MRTKNSLFYSIFSLLFFTLIATLLVASTYSSEFLLNRMDYMNHIAGIIQAKQALLQGQFPLRIAPFEQNGMGYPYFQFYSPTGYLIAGCIYRWITPMNPILAYQLTIGCALVVGGFFMERLALQFAPSKTAALLTGVVYIAAPYYVVLANQLGNLTETIALGILPMVLYYTLQQFRFPFKSRATSWTSSSESPTQIIF